MPSPSAGRCAERSPCTNGSKIRSQHLGRDADAGVAHAEDRVAALRATDVAMGPGLGVLGGVVQQVADDLLQPRGVGVHHQRLRRRGHGARARARRGAAARSPPPAHDVRQVHPLLAQLDRPRVMRETSSRSSTSRTMWRSCRSIISRMRAWPRRGGRARAGSRAALRRGASGLRSSWPSMARNSSLACARCSQLRQQARALLLGAPPIEELADLRAHGGEHAQQVVVGRPDLAAEELDDAQHLGPRRMGNPNAACSPSAAASGRAREVRVPTTSGIHRAARSPHAAGQPDPARERALAGGLRERGADTRGSCQTSWQRSSPPPVESRGRRRPTQGLADGAEDARGRRPGWRSRPAPASRDSRRRAGARRCAARRWRRRAPARWPPSPP